MEGKETPFAAPVRPASGEQFHSTLWTLVAAAFAPAARGTILAADDAASQNAFAELCRLYWYPLFAYVRRRGYNPHDAQDLTQDFFVHLLSRRDQGRVDPDPEKGQFRAFLLTALKNFLRDRHREQSRALRSAVRFVPLDTGGLEIRYRQEPVPAAGARDAETFYEQKWATALVESALDNLRTELAAGRGGNRVAARFERLRPFLIGASDPAAEARAAVACGTEIGAFRTALSRLRRQYRSCLRAEIVRTVAEPGAVDGEIRHLCAVLAGVGGAAG